MMEIVTMLEAQTLELLIVVIVVLRQDLEALIEIDLFLLDLLQHTMDALIGERQSRLLNIREDFNVEVQSN